MADPRVEATARAFHDAYERLAPDHGYRTREASAVPWDDVPEQNKALMRATVAEVLGGLLAELDEAKVQREAAALRSIEARNPGIDMDEVRRSRDRAVEPVGPLTVRTAPDGSQHVMSPPATDTPCPTCHGKGYDPEVGVHINANPTTPESIEAVNAVIEAVLRRYAPCPDCIQRAAT